MPLHDPISGPYPIPDDEREAFGDAWCLKVNTAPYGEELLCAVFEPEDGGLRVEVYRKAYPAEFYKVVIQGHDSTLHTGAGEGMRQLVIDIAREVAAGMLEIVPVKS